ncbi:hydroxyacid dehydrogenase [Paenibacillus senegalensis]|uniref:hydroxyacid dehydrogenase n=1 Tax=Paenibacillus senegalensis TaxID=1465766 RepID=UPI00028829CE|nr:hydroxyacid dehydrogenase [Paenibacillus senegalensis]
MNLALMAERHVLERIFREKEKQRLLHSGLEISWPEEHLTREQMHIQARNADILITSWGSPKLDASVLDAAPNLQLVLHAAGSIKPVVTPELWERGIRISSSADALAVGVAETALGFTIVSLKNMWNLSASTRQGGWNEGKQQIKELYGLKAGVIGAGRAGRHYIRLLRNFQVDIYVYDPTLSADDPLHTVAKPCSLEELLRVCDVVSIHAPSIPATRHLLNADTLSLMKDDAIIINTARGTIIDEAALVNELEKGRLFACLDVTDPEPPDGDHPFRHLPNVILTPHIAGAVNNGLGRIGEYVLNELEQFLRGESLAGEVSPDQLGQLA